LLLERLEDRMVPATLTVTSLNDVGIITSGDGTLRGEILAANPLGGDTIVFDPSLTGIIQLDPGNGELLLNKGLTINGPGANILEVSGNPSNRVFDVLAVTDVISGLTIEHGQAALGGGIRNVGNLTLQADTFTANSASSNGGGLANFGTAFVSGCNFTGNLASGDGGAIFNNVARDLTVQNCYLADNGASFGGGIFNTSTAKVQDSSFCFNTASQFGGGIYNSGTLTVDNGYFSFNAADAAGGGIVNVGSATVLNSLLESNHAGLSGGGITNGSGGSLDVGNTTISNNFTTAASGAAGGGILNGGTLTVESGSRLYGNSSNFGGGIWNTGTATVTDSSITGNSATNEGGGIDNFGPGSVLFVNNSTVENNTAPPLSGKDLHNDGSATLNNSDVDDITTDPGGTTTINNPVVD
jgi:hypothetical protein